jgi:hypothetical protein
MTSTASQHSQRCVPSHIVSNPAMCGHQSTRSIIVDYYMDDHRGLLASDIEAQPGEELGEGTRLARTSRQSRNLPESASPSRP